MTSSNAVVQCRGCPRRLTVKYAEWRQGLLLCATCAAWLDDYMRRNRVEGTDLVRVAE